MTAASQGMILSLSDLNTALDAEPRILDVMLAERLGFSRPVDIRKLISRNFSELRAYGEVYATMAQTSSQLGEVFTQSVKTSAKGGRPSTAFYLNESQALLICMFSRTPKAAQVRKAIIDVFMAYRRGQLAPPPVAPKLPAHVVSNEPMIAALCQAYGTVRDAATKWTDGYLAELDGLIVSKGLKGSPEHAASGARYNALMEGAKHVHENTKMLRQQLADTRATTLAAIKLKARMGQDGFYEAQVIATAVCRDLLALDDGEGA
jgi:hypothetical protein